jgi:hypothetical protein
LGPGADFQITAEHRSTVLSETGIRCGSQAAHSRDRPDTKREADEHDS